MIWETQILLIVPVSTIKWYEDQIHETEHVPESLIVLKHFTDYTETTNKILNELANVNPSNSLK
jgi:hypothetical protein